MVKINRVIGYIRTVVHKHVLHNESVILRINISEDYLKKNFTGEFEK